MNIGFDAKRAVQNNTGLGNYSRFIIEVLSEYYPDNTYFLFAPKQKNNDRLKTLISRTCVAFIFPSGISKLLPSLWRIFGCKKKISKHKMEIFHGLSNELPVNIRTSIKTVVSIHDLIFLRYPEYYKPTDRFIYRLKFQYACNRADKIIAVSECTKHDIVSFFGIDERKIKVVYQGCHPQFKQPVTEEKQLQIAEKHRLPKRFILYVGTIEQRKNLLLTVKALIRLPETIHLVAIGKSTPYRLEIEQYVQNAGLTPRLHIKTDFPFEDLPAVYQQASVFVYPSVYEGFGIPVIEALSCSVPVIAAAGSCLEEAGGPNSVYVNPRDDVELAAKIREIMENTDLAQAMAKQGLEYVKQFDSHLVAEKIMEIYTELLLNNKK
jgi:glycosyltransferase involved in cell wall biosynthesis